MHVPFVFSSIQPYPPFAIAVSFCMSSGPPSPPVALCTRQPQLEAFPNPRLWVGATSPAFSGWLVIYSSSEGLPLHPSPVALSTRQLQLQAFPSLRLLGRCRHSRLPWPARLFAVCLTDCLSCTIQDSRHPTLFATCFFFFKFCCLFIFQFVFFLPG
jgi:hypothetical protein